MADRKPLIVVSGEITELPTADTLVAGSATINGVAVPRITVSTTAPTTPTPNTNDIWIDIS